MSDTEKLALESQTVESSRQPRSEFVQLHLWTRREDVAYLRQVAAERDQTVSAVVRSIVRAYRRSRSA